MFLSDLESMAVHDLSDKMDLEGMDLGGVITDAITVYRDDFPEKDRKFALLAEEVYTVNQFGHAERGEGKVFNFFE